MPKEELENEELDEEVEETTEKEEKVEIDFSLDPSERLATKKAQKNGRQ